MNVLNGPVSIDLGDGRTLRLEDARGASLTVTCGEVWVTQEGDVRDIVLDAGSRYVLERDGRTVLQALAPARITIGALPLAVSPAAASKPGMHNPRRWYVGASNVA